MIDTALKIDVLSILNRIGSQDRKDLYSTVAGCTHRHLTSMEKSGFIRRPKGDEDTFTITNAGRRRIGAATPKTVAASRPSVVAEEYYDGAELRPYTGRPGCEAALALPSRRPDGLVYPDGRFVCNEEAGL